MSDFYNELGVPKTATADEIKKAYRNLAFKYHPDRNPGDAVAEEKFKKISAAYDVLGDEQKRRNYDLTGSTSEQTYSRSSQSYSQNDYEDFYSAFYGNYQGGQRRQYRYTYTNPFEGERPKRATRRDYWHLLFSKTIQTLGALFFFRISFIIPFGGLICLWVFWSGVSGIFQAIRGISLTSKEK